MSHTDVPPTKISDECSAAYEAAKLGSLTVICGRNNSGKTFVLRQMLRDLGNTASYLGPARYQNFTLLAAIQSVAKKGPEKYQEILNHINNNEQNIDNSPINLGEAISNLRDTQRTKLFNLVEILLGAKPSIQKIIPDNDMSQRYVEVDGYNISFSSSGIRLVTTLLCSLIDSDFEHFLIDEPELGISPEVQGVLADFLFDDEKREEHFPHIKSVTLATHSPVFLDRKNVSNNFFIDRDFPEIKVRQISDVQDLNSLQFLLLGNRFETLYLPSAILFVEGKCDFKYFDAAVKKRFPDHLVSVVQCNGDDRVKERVYLANQMFGKIQHGHTMTGFSLFSMKHIRILYRRT